MNKNNILEEYKTFNSHLIKKSEELTFHNSKYNKKLYINHNEILSNDLFYVFLSKDKITFLDENGNFKDLFISYSFENKIVEKKYMIIGDNKNNNIFINNYNILNYQNFIPYKIGENTILYNEKNSYLINEDGSIENKQLNNKKVKLFLQILDKVGGLENFIYLVATYN